MRRTPFAPALLALALPACSSGGPTVAEQADPAGVLATSTYVLRRVDGALVPARVYESGEGYQVVLADTLRFGADGVVRIRGAVRTVAYGTAVPEDRVYDVRHDWPYAVHGASVRVGAPTCDDVVIRSSLGICAANDTGSVRGDSLLLAAEYHGAVRRAYVRVAAP